MPCSVRQKLPQAPRVVRRKESRRKFINEGCAPLFYRSIFEYLFNKKIIQQNLKTAGRRSGGTVMKKVFKLEDLDCANCAAKMERAVARLDGVTSVSISFMAQRMAIEADEARFDEIMERVEKACRKVEPDCRILR